MQRMRQLSLAAAAEYLASPISAEDDISLWIGERLTSIQRPRFPATELLMLFQQWLAEILGEDEDEVGRLLSDESGLHFLLTWSLFESKCFHESLKAEGLRKFADRIVDDEDFDIGALAAATKHFHQRYQDAERFRNLIHRKSLKKLNPDETLMSNLLKKDIAALSEAESVFLVAFTTYRFRNNIFHGNKGVRSWLNFKTEIGLCISALQSFVSHAEALCPTLQSVATT